MKQPKSEDQLQAQCFQYHWNHYPSQRGRLFLVHNNPKNGIDGARLKAIGLVKGAPDMVLCGNEGEFVGLEFKEPGGKGRQSPDQIKVQQAICSTLKGWYYIVDSFELFTALILNYCGNPEIEPRQ